MDTNAVLVIQIRIGSKSTQKHFLIIFKTLTSHIVDGYATQEYKWKV